MKTRANSAEPVRVRLLISALVVSTVATVLIVMETQNASAEIIKVLTTLRDVIVGIPVIRILTCCNRTQITDAKAHDHQIG